MVQKATDEKKSPLPTIIGAVIALLVGVWVLKRVIGAVFWIVQLGIVAVVVGGVVWLVLQVTNRKS